MAKEAAEFKTGNDVDFTDGQGPKSKDTPDHFPSDWHREAHNRALADNYAGLRHRLAELQAMPGAHPDEVAAAEQAVKDAKSSLPTGPAQATRRPRKAKETR